MKKLIAASIATAILSGCATPVGIGKSVAVVPIYSAHLTQCKVIGSIEVEARTAGLWDYNEQTREAKNRLRDAVATKFPTADTVGMSDIDMSGLDPNTDVMGVAYKCYDNLISN